MTFRAREREKNAKLAGGIARLLAPGTNEAKATKSAAAALEDIEDHFAFLCGAHVTDSKMRAKLRRLADAIGRVVAPWNELIEGGVIPFDAPIKVLGDMDDFLAFGKLCRKVADAAEKEKRTKPDIDAAMKVKAVELAFSLVKQYGLKPSYADPNSKYCQIAKLLHGGGEKLTKQCKTYADAHSPRRAKKTRA